MESCEVAGSGSAGSPYGTSVAQEHYNGSGVRVPLPVEPHLARCMLRLLWRSGLGESACGLSHIKKRGAPASPIALCISLYVPSQTPGCKVAGPALLPALNHKPSLLELCPPSGTFSPSEIKIEPRLARKNSRVSTISFRLSVWVP